MTYSMVFLVALLGVTVAVWFNEGLLMAFFVWVAGLIVIAAVKAIWPRRRR